VTSRTLYQGAFLDQAFIPAIVLVALSFAVCIIEVILLIVVTQDPTSVIVDSISGVILAFVMIISFIYFFAAYRIFYRTKSIGKARRKSFLVMSAKIVASGISNLLLIFFAALILVSQSNIVFSFTSIFCFNLSFTIRSFLQIEVFGTPGLKKRSKTSLSTIEENATT